MAAQGLEVHPAAPGAAFYGVSVNVAARIAGEAGADEVLISGLAV